MLGCVLQNRGDILPSVCSLPKGELEHLTTSQTMTLMQSVMITFFYLCIPVYFLMWHMIDASYSASFPSSPGSSFHIFHIFILGVRRKNKKKHQ